MTPRDRVALFILSGIVFAITVAAFVALSIAGKPTGDLLGLVGPVITGLFLVGVLGGKIDETKAVAETAVAQTNGQLDARFREHAEEAAVRAVTKALSHPAGSAPRHAASPSTGGEESSIRAVTKALSQPAGPSPSSEDGAS